MLGIASRRTTWTTAVLVLTMGLALGLPATWAGTGGDEEENEKDESFLEAFEAWSQGRRLSEEEAERLFGFPGPGELRSLQPLPEPPNTSIPRPRFRGWPPMATCLAQGGGAEARDPCRLGRAASRMPACVDPDDCPAYETWREYFGPPGMRTVPEHPRPGQGPAFASEETPKEDEEP